ncbi:transposase [Alterisphingorhabdus coralli]|uniref:Transposase n=1 Tax=Alterisphingorhabdus coralli TaxID=3071408 RepID=A0AA97FAE8_9SPHN|nr:transposase [Parasphingorhabdus sp. SCSIO 66989]WOE76222.1 transposase [Parasphingorhabdus sp. SCSIO 66989]
MALDISRTADVSLSLAEALEAFDALAPSVESEEQRDLAADILARLALDRDCISDAAIAELKQYHSAKIATESYGQRQYGPQVIMLGEPRPGWFLRANIWPAKPDYAVKASGEAAFFYGLPHDHNFDFLTIGYHGPGYVSDYYEQDYGSLAGFRGEPAGLRFVERSRLSEGRMLHYRKHRDVHCQYPPEALSISLNLMLTAWDQPWTDQYSYDLERNRIGHILSFGASDILLRLAVDSGLGDGLELAETVMQKHPSHRLRSVALDALYHHFADNPRQQNALLDKALSSDSALLIGEAERLSGV